ncbi:MAG: prepilin-type N-terminal cleavage/methylation domain-containing protein [Clostridium sp.]|uniref:PilW family protein n=1 Tax=Clostridium sp. TaxID=1506 RepID=UPI0025BABF4A|nr:prepilin-type N-terminal cleavage/methylation domain-containing protein [Clostridium sp.]MCE5221063.1 prepilin-type N-terminal cleavage/methylation domain-containing protein [Clostridium sp.]
MKKKKPGFTLIEMIIVLALTVIVLGITSSMFITGNKVFSDSDIKSTLQMDGQAIQEKISDIGMQATTAQAVTVENSGTNEINDITINSYDKDGNLRPFTIEKKDSGSVYKDGRSKIYKLWVDGKLISSNVKSVMLDNNTITDAKANTLKNVNSIEFTIILRKEKGYSNIEQSVDFRVAFRNK